MINPDILGLEGKRALVVGADLDAGRAATAAKEIEGLGVRSRALSGDGGQRAAFPHGRSTQTIQLADTQPAARSD